MCASSYSRRVVPRFSSSHGHDVVHLPFLSGLAGVTVWYEHFVQQVGAVQTFACWETIWKLLTACDTGGEAAGGLVLTWDSCRLSSSRCRSKFNLFGELKRETVQVRDLSHLMCRKIMWGLHFHNNMYDVKEGSPFRKRLYGGHRDNRAKLKSWKQQLTQLCQSFCHCVWIRWQSAQSAEHQLTLWRSRFEPAVSLPRRHGGLH